MGDRGERALREGYRVFCLEWIDIRVISKEEPIFKGFHHFADVIRQVKRGNKEWGDVFN